MNPLLIILGVIGGIFALVVFGLAFNIIGLWFQSVVSGAKSGLFDLIMMRFRKVNPRVIVVNRITAKKAGIDIPTDWLEAHFLAGGRVQVSSPNGKYLNSRQCWTAQFRSGAQGLS